MKKNLMFRSIVMLLGLMIFFTGCSSKDNQEASPENNDTAVSEAFNGDKIVDIEYVKANVNNENFLAIDARGPEAMAKSGSLEGAIGVVWQQLSTVIDGKPGDPNWGVVLDKERLSSALSEIGITKDKDIVIFADTKTGWGDDGRILWTLSLAGYDNARILDGGIDAIMNASLATSKEPAPYVPAEVVIENIDLTSSISTDELAALLTDNNVKLIDTRTASEYEGAADYGESKGGHIPGAVNINFAEFLREDGTLKSNAEIDYIMSANDIAKDDVIVTYCTAGIRSAYMQQILEMNGYTNVRNYDESYYRWAEINEVE